MIFPHRVLDDLMYNKFVWIEGQNRSGKDLLALDLFTYFGDIGYRLVSNTHCVLADDPRKIHIDYENFQFNTFIIESEAGTFNRTKQSIRVTMGAKGKLGLIFCMASSEAPHEDLWTFRISPVGKFNPYVRVWRATLFNATGRDTKYYFLQLGGKALFGLYSTLYFGFSASSILSFTERALQEHSQAVSGFLGFENIPLELLDLSTSAAGMADNQSYLSYQVAAKTMEGSRELQRALVQQTRKHK